MAEVEKSKDTGFKRKRSKILYEITGLIVVVLVISGLVTFFLVRNSQNELIDKSVDKLIETESNDITSALDYLTQKEVESGMATTGLEDFDIAQFLADMQQKKLTGYQESTAEVMKRMVDSGFFDLEYYFLIVPPSSFTPEPFVLVSSDVNMIYDWEVPGYMTEAMEAGEPYLLLEEGIPELGLEGAQLMILLTQESPIIKGFYFTSVCVIPMQERIDAINAFYSEERNNVSLTLGLSVFLSILAVVIITFFVLNYLIRKRITEPIDQLAAEAGEVMEGNLDVEVEVHEGGEFQGLERAFKEMVESIRKYIIRSTGEE
jgi:methyl-accepting chemotaxis protein